MKRVELLAPAGDLEKLKMAITYGADAVYLGGESFGLRKASKNFTLEEIEKAVKIVHDLDKKVYVTLNIVPHDDDLIGLDEYVKELYRINVDAVIVSDPGVFNIVRNSANELPIHLSTQASITNFETIMFWYNLGIKRIVLARELTLDEIREISKKAPNDLELEVFVHGAMCMSYSGRCLLSSYMTGRDANRGDCAQACRYKYNVVEEKRPGEYFPIEEHEEGTFIFNSKDLCMIEHVDELIQSGIKSFKIEGRVKSSYYVATVVGAYRKAIDDYYKDPINYKFDERLLTELKKVSHRDFTTGFFYNEAKTNAQVYTTNSYIRKYDFVGMIKDYDEKNKIATIEQRNRINIGDTLEVFGPDREYFELVIKEMWNEDNEPIESAPHAQQIIKVKIDEQVKPFYLIRKKRDDI
ncbi:MAG: U32 family peptidase [Tissierellales bacterium]|nr:U32 family peptidase [Tissierellales bacterium]